MEEKGEFALMSSVRKLNEKKRNLFKNPLVTVLLYFAFGVFLAYVFYKNKDAIRLLTLDSMSYFAIMLCITLVMIFLNGVMNVVAFSSTGRKVSMLDGFKIAAMVILGNYLPFSAGIIARGVYITNKYGMTAARYAALSIYILIVTFVVSGLLGLSTTLMIDPGIYLFHAVFLAMILAGVFLFFPLQLIPFIRKRIKEERFNLLGMLTREKNLQLFVGLLALFVVAAFRIYFSFQIVGEYVPFDHLLILICGAAFTRLAAVTPGAIGIREAIFAALSHFLGINYELAIMAVGINRLADLVIVLSVWMLVIKKER